MSMKPLNFRQQEHWGFENVGSSIGIRAPSGAIDPAQLRQVMLRQPNNLCTEKTALTASSGNESYK